MHARYYNPSLQRFLTIDPIGGTPRNPQSWNRYAYVSNNPINFKDALGLAAAAAGSSPGNVDCPPGTEGISCFTTTAPDPGTPQLPPDYLTRQPFFWEANSTGIQIVDGLRVDREATLRYQASQGDEFAIMQLGQAILGLEEDVDTGMLLAGGVVGLIRFGGATAPLPKIVGFTKHAMNQAVSREGRGVTTRAILDAMKNPVAIKRMGDGTTRFIGKEATAVVNELMRVVTLWARSSSAWRIVP
jgi:hypothetical protein